MKFRHNKPTRLALLSGHVAVVDQEWRTLDERFHQAALNAGCQCDQTVIPDRPEIAGTRSSEADTPLDEKVAIRKAIITMAGRKEEGDFTSAGNPNLNALAKLTGFRVDKESMLEVWKELQDEAKAAGDTDAGADADAGSDDEQPED